MLNNSAIQTSFIMCLKVIGVISYGVFGSFYIYEGINTIKNIITNQANESAPMMRAMVDLAKGIILANLAIICLKTHSAFWMTCSALCGSIPLIILAINKAIDIKITMDEKKLNAIVVPFMEAIHDGNHETIVQIIRENPTLREKLTAVYINSYPNDNQVYMI